MPMAWAVGQVDFSTGVVLPVAIISMCSFVPFPLPIVKKVLGQMVTKCVTTSRLWSAEAKKEAKTFLVLKSIGKAMHAVLKRLCMPLKRPSQLRKTS